MQNQAWSTNRHLAIDRSIAIDLLAIPALQAADDAMQMNIPKTLYPFSPINLCWLNLNS